MDGWDVCYVQRVWVFEIKISEQFPFCSWPQRDSATLRVLHIFREESQVNKGANTQTRTHTHKRTKRQTSIPKHTHTHPHIYIYMVTYAKTGTKNIQKDTLRYAYIHKHTNTNIK